MEVISYISHFHYAIEVMTLQPREAQMIALSSQDLQECRDTRSRGGMCQCRHHMISGTLPVYMGYYILLYIELQRNSISSNGQVI